ncbi:hypothetical protein BDV25DRAFT_158907, partial [Aspergillus avenaceus]
MGLRGVYLYFGLTCFICTCNGIIPLVCRCVNIGFALSRDAFAPSKNKIKIKI